MDRKVPEFATDFQPQAEKLLGEKAVLPPLFSRGTYQFEVLDEKKRAYPFIQMNDQGEISDFFCSCKVSESGHGCPHLAASYLFIFKEFEEPLHVRFKKSLWNRLFQMLSKKHGYDPKVLKKDEKGYACFSKDQEVVFSIFSRNLQRQQKLKEIIEEKEEETEETSIKFSNLPSEELEAYRKGQGAHPLLYELSFWSDLAKWLLYLQEENEEYQLAFEGKGLPVSLHVSFQELDLFFHISEASWPWLIPSLKSVKSPLKVFDQEDTSIEKIEYDPAERVLRILHKEKDEKDVGVLIGEWHFLEGRGFYRKRHDPYLSSTRVSSDRIALALSNSSKTIQKFIPVFEEMRKCQYLLYFDSHQSLHIELYVKEPGDMKQSSAAVFFPWVYLPAEGFFQMEEWLFEGIEKVIQKEDVADFIGGHKTWLHNYRGFEVHLGSLESHLSYRLTESELVFSAELNFPENHEETYHFDEWVYIRGQGFYMKKQARSRLPIHPGLKIPLSEIGNFIKNHHEELEQVLGFFTDLRPIRKMGLDLGVGEKGRIVIMPQIEYEEGISETSFTRFGDYYYLKNEGFFEIPPISRLPERYSHQVEIDPSQESSFLAYELEPLKKYILKIDPRLIAPSNLKLKIRKIAPSRKKRGKEWRLNLVYQSEFGSIDLFSIWDAFQEKKRNLFSKAGLLHLKEPRFNWLRQISKKNLDRKKGEIRLTTLEWIRLSIFEIVEEPEEPEMKQFLSELGRLESDEVLDISKLKAKLRPYQEEGLKWLWFLYCHGLSGLLCDDMGLGKTHQTMALLASVVQRDEEREFKYLVVCPTSVIYHWQELLKRFLPDIRVLTYYGVERSIDPFEKDYDLLLTSYGILRTGKENLKGFRFEIAIFDEIQIAKNHASQTHKALKAIRSEMKLGLTGTPIENRIRELKALLDLVLPGYMPSDPVFREMFILPIEKSQDAPKKELLNQLIKPFVLRRKKTEVLRDLPEKIEEIAYSDLSLEQLELYREVAKKMQDTVVADLKNKEKPVSFLHVFSALSQLKQICNHPALILDDVQNYQKHSSGKWDLFVELLYEARDSGQKVVVFSQYLEMLKIIEKYLKKKGVGFASIKGSTQNRPEQLRRFREDPDCLVFCASLLAAGVGIDLTTASIVIHYDRWWNPAKENQATDRVHRIGQNRGVQVFKLVTKNTIEEHIHQMIERKKGLLEEIVGTEDQISYLSRDELLEVFEKINQELF